MSEKESDAIHRAERRRFVAVTVAVGPQQFDGRADRSVAVLLCCATRVLRWCCMICCPRVCHCDVCCCAVLCCVSVVCSSVLLCCVVLCCADRCGAVWCSQGGAEAAADPSRSPLTRAQLARWGRPSFGGAAGQPVDLVMGFLDDIGDLICSVRSRSLFSLSRCRLCVRACVYVCACTPC